MSEQTQQPSLEQRLNALAESTAFTLKVHTDMMMSIDTKLESIATDLQELTANSKRDAESIRALARIAEIHERRLSDIEGDEQPH